MSQVGFERVYSEELSKKYFSKIDLALLEKLDWKPQETNKLATSLKNLSYCLLSCLKEAKSYCLC